MARGYSLEQDLRLLINNPKYSDIEILCGDEEKLHGCRAILAARSEVFDRLLYNGMKETYEKQISFPEIDSSGMEIVLEYIYTGLIKEESLTKDNIVEAFRAADYFQLSDLQDFIIKFIKNTNYSSELLSDAVDMMPLSEDNVLLNLLVEKVSTTPLNTIEFGRLSITALQYVLSCTHEKEKPFKTPEYEVFRYSAILSAKQVSNDAYESIMERLPTLEQLENSIQLENKVINNHQKIANELEPLIKFIDFRRIKAQILTDIIEPLEIIPAEIISNAYQYKTKSNNLDLSYFRGTFYFWDKSACGSKIIIKDNGKVVQASNDCIVHQSVGAKIILGNKSIVEWDIIIEKTCALAWVGVYAPNNFSYEIFAGLQMNELVLLLGSHGGYYSNFNGNADVLNYCPPFGDGAKITVHLDMNERTCAFTVNSIRYPEILAWNDLSSKLYPVVSLKYPDRIRIQPHQRI